MKKTFDMKKPPLMRWPGGKRYACTTSWDDGVEPDRRTIEILNKHGIKGTFNLNSSFLGRKGNQPSRNVIPPDQIAAVYKGHEVAIHGATHPWPSQIHPSTWLKDAIDDKQALEKLVGYVVRGAAWPFGDYSPVACDILRLAGIVHARTTRETKNFSIPEAGTWLTWHPTCHYTNADNALWKSFMNRSIASLFYLWGHSYEPEEKSDWNLLEDWAAMAGAEKQIWHATNIHVYDYVEAWRSLAFSVERDVVYNPSCQTIWFAIGEQVYEAPAGQTKELKA